MCLIVCAILLIFDSPFIIILIILKIFASTGIKISYQLITLYVM